MIKVEQEKQEFPLTETTDNYQKLLNSYLRSNFIRYLISRRRLTVEQAKENFSKTDLGKLQPDHIEWIAHGILPHELTNKNLTRRALFVTDYLPLVTYHEGTAYTFLPFDYSDEQIEGVYCYKLTTEQVSHPRFDSILNLLRKNLINTSDYNEVANLSDELFTYLIKSRLSFCIWKSSIDYRMAFTNNIDYKTESELMIHF